MSDHIKTGLIGGPSDGMLLESNRQMARELQSLRTRLEAAERQAKEDAVNHAAARRRVIVLMKERDEARAQAIKEGERIGELVAEQVVYRARIRELEEALRPFAEEAKTWADTLPGTEPVYTASDCFVCSHCGEGSGIERAFTVGDLRRAKELVTPTHEDTP